MFTGAGKAEIIRSNQKDEFYSTYIRGTLAELTQSILGPGVWMRWRKELDLLADLGYFGLTTLAGYQTLGEEYVNIVQVDDTKRAIPSKLSRGAMILLQVAAPYALDRLLAHWERHLQSNPALGLTPEGRALLLRLVTVSRGAVTFVHRCHVTLFYLRGVFYHLAKRLTGVHYLRVRSGSGAASSTSYNILGWLSFTQMLLVFLHQSFRLYKQHAANRDKMHGGDQVVESYQQPDRSTGDGDATSDPTLRCALCLETRRDSTATPCGHVFCWSCINEWCSTKPQCPLCREKAEMSRLIFLQNYDT